MGAGVSLTGTWSRLRLERLEWRVAEYGGAPACESGECAALALAITRLPQLRGR